MTPVKPIEKLCELLDEHDEYYESFGNRVWWGRPIDAQTGEPINVFHNIAEPAGGDRLRVELQLATPEQAVAATVGNERLVFLEEKVKRQGEYIVKLAKEKKALFAQNCEAATRHAGQMDYMQRKLDTATVSPKTAKRVVTTNPETDGATGRCHCGACNWIIDPYDRFCRRCGARLED